MSDQPIKVNISTTNYLWRRKDGLHNITGYNPMQYPQDGFQSSDYELLVMFEGGFVWGQGVLYYEIDGLPFTYESPYWAADRQAAEEVAVVRAAERILDSESLKDFRL